MSQQQSEELFASYLAKYGIASERQYVVNPRSGSNVDFRITFGAQSVLADVKEVQEIPKREGEIIAGRQIRSDLKKLRRKFGTELPTCPVILVTVNGSKGFFTGLTVVQSMLGSIEVVFRKSDFKQISPLRHSKKGSATFTRRQNTTISGILVLTQNLRNSYFGNPYARHPFDGTLFPQTTVYYPKSDAVGDEITVYSRIMF